MALTRAQRLAGAAFSAGRPFDPGQLIGVLGNRQQFAVTQTGMERALARLAELNVASDQELQRALAEESDVALRRIKASWPKDTGFSAARWQRAFRGRFQVVLQNDAEYVRYVHRKGNPTPLVESDVPDEIRRARERILRRLRRIVRDRIVEFRGRGVDLRREARAIFR